jgi:uncharacterized membrane protein HdeD (DUF308 family)
VGFIPLGLSFIVFARQSGSWFSSPIPSAFFLLTGLSIILAGIFPTDPENRRETASGKIHAAAVIVLMLLLRAAPFTFSIPALYRNPPPGWFLVFSSVMGILVSILVAFSSNETCARHLVLFQRTSRPMPGLLQRLVLILDYIWWLVFSQVLAGEYHLR